MGGFYCLFFTVSVLSETFMISVNSKLISELSLTDCTKLQLSSPVVLGPLFNGICINRLS